MTEERPRLAALDLISAKLHQDARPLDFSAILELTVSPEMAERLAMGAESACRLYPTSASRVDGRHWEWSDEVPFSSLSLKEGQSVEELVHEFVNQDMNPHAGPQVRQQLVLGGERPVLLSRFHHCAFDGASASMWLFHQLMVAAGQLPAETQSGDWSPPSLAHHDAPHRKSKYAHWGGARRLWMDGKQPSAERRCVSIQLDSRPIRTAIAGLEGVTYNDFLAAHFTQALVEWNAQHGAPTTQLALWLPTNIRPSPFEGFGNGSSRMRVYADSMAGPGVVDRCQQFREQVTWSRANGEWYVPPADGLQKLPDTWLAPFLRAYLGRPGVDMGTAPFTHLERIGMMDRFVPMIHSARWVMMLHKWHPIGMAAATLGEHTDMTLTYDPAQFSDASAEGFLALYESLLVAGLQELST